MTKTERLVCTVIKTFPIGKRYKKCLECKKGPTFNNPGEKISLYCADHKKVGMVNVKNKKCLECNKQPTFNNPGEKNSMYCANHKKVGMVDVRNKICLECRIIPNFNNPGEKVALYCANHKKVGMVDVKSKTCLECNKQPNFNNPGEKVALYCANHKKVGMVDVRSKTCLECSKQPAFNNPGEKVGLYCADHKKVGMENVISKKCVTHLCNTNVGNTYRGYCLRCFLYTFPDEPVSRNYKTKEKAVTDFILDAFPDNTWSVDRRVLDACSRRRPDMCLDLGFQVLVIEVDENQHTDYDCSCENKRLMEISKDIGHRNLVFLRFNPDTYVNQKNQRVASCWSTNGKGITQVSVKKRAEWASRLETLRNQVIYWTEHRTNKTVEVVQLFYDCV